MSKISFLMNISNRKTNLLRNIFKFELWKASIKEVHGMKVVFCKEIML